MLKYFLIFKKNFFVKLCIYFENISVLVSNEVQSKLEVTM